MNRKECRRRRMTKSRGDSRRRSKWNQKRWKSRARLRRKTERNGEKRKGIN